MDSFQAFKQKQKSKKKANKTVSFLESLKGLGSSVKNQSKDAVGGVGKGVVNQIFGQSGSLNNQRGELNQNQPFNFKDYLQSQERQIEARQKHQLENQLKREQLVFSRKDEQAKLQIKSIQEELKKLAQETQGLSQEVKKAVFNGVIEPGVYHFNFFDRIRNLIILMRKQVAESRSWLQTFNRRKKHRQGFYWAQSKKSGTKYMLSQERTLATQTG